MIAASYRLCVHEDRLAGRHGLALDVVLVGCDYRRYEIVAVYRDLRVASK